jgi:hypothetical protein
LPAEQIARLQGRSSIFILENTLPLPLPWWSWGVSSDVLWGENKKKGRIFKEMEKRNKKGKKKVKGYIFIFITYKREESKGI